MRSDISGKNYITLISSCAVYLLLAVALVTLGESMIRDSDPLWHFAAGDLIRETHSIPLTDPWSFSAGDYRWLNISWAWDVVFSYMKELGNWHAAITLNALTIALTVTLVYSACMLRTGNGIASFFTTFLTLTMITPHLRPLQVSHLMVAVWMLLLGQIARGKLPLKWLAALPLLTIIWVNCHGGYIFIPIMLGAFFLQAVREKNHGFAKPLFITGIACLAAMLCNPYGIHIFEAAWRPLTTSANDFINEWKPFNASLGNLAGNGFIVLFIALVTNRKLPQILPAERFLAFGTLLYGLTCIRFMSFFAIVAAPLLACRIADYFAQPDTGKATQQAIRIRNWASAQCTKKSVACSALLACMVVSGLLFTPMAASAYKIEVKIPSLKEEIAFIKTHYPEKHFLNEFLVGGYLVYETRGDVPVFIDPRTETAFPSIVMKDYARFLDGKEGWEDIFTRYHMDGMILMKDSIMPFGERFDHRTGFKKVFEGPNASIYIVK